ncbi:hypothetical protein [Synechococcus sp. PCC 7336]|uniref:hypothetical protein n=1 Tax=Synechococcus sp. PCC 7336 TaxID=195250 RepID=UPI000347B125|nr:hypothetical protein [Synechococcus sp. PCC 7336]
MKSFATRWFERVLLLPEVNLFVFAFLVNFVYEVWQSPFFEFYDRSSLAAKIAAINHCTVGDGIIIVVCYWIASLLLRSRFWILQPGWRQVVLFASLGFAYTFVSEIYRVRIAHLYGLSGLVVPGIGISWLPLLQWIVLPPLILYFVRWQLLGHAKISQPQQDR